MGAALIFVAYEGFELIPNAINDMENPARDLGRGILMSILITTVIYILVSLVAVTCSLQISASTRNMPLHLP